MKKKTSWRTVSLRAFQILSILILILLIVSTFIPQRSEYPPGAYPGEVPQALHLLFLDRFYDSPLNAALWIALSIVLLAAVMFNGIRSFHQKILHLMLAVIFLLIAADKFNNERFFMTLREGETVSFSEYVSRREKVYNIDLTLKRFEIEMHPDGRTPKAFRSHLRINNEELAVLTVNKPLSIGQYRLYQSAYDKNFYFVVHVGDSLHEVTFGDTLPSPSGPVVLHSYDHRTRSFILLEDDIRHRLPLEQPATINTIQWYISPQGEHYSSVIEVAEVTGLRWLLAAAMIYLAVMAWDFWFRRKKGGSE
ncbi:MAG: cytochrome c biogenesis protein ResB [Fidelibacterota bacterium]